MADQLDIRDLLSKPLSDYPDLPPLPANKTFYGKIVDVTADNSREKKTPFFHFSVRLTDPGKDVDKRDMEKITSAGFSLADYEAGSNFYVTPNAMKMLRRFLSTLGFSENISFIENLRLDPVTGNPTDETRELVRGRDVIVRTPEADDQGRVFLNNLSISGEVTK